MAIPPPYRGQPLRASWAAEITSAVNDLALMSPEGMLTRSGPSGCGFAPVPSNRRQPVASLPPFLVRHVAQSLADPTIPYTGYEIYLPTGCVSVGSTCAPLNPPAYRTVDGSTVNQTGWYRLPSPETPSSAKSWPVVIHAKCCSAISGVDSFQEWPKRYLWAEIQPDPSDVTQAYREADENDVGDTFASTVGSIEWSVNETTQDVSQAYRQSVRVPIHVSALSAQPFDLYFAFEVDSSTLGLSLDRLFVRNLSFSAAGATFYADGLRELQTTDESVYLKITTRTSPYTATVVVYNNQQIAGTTLTASAQVEAARQDGEIYVRLYQLKNGHVVVNGLSSLQNIQIYQ